MVPSTPLVVDDRIERTRSARSGSTRSTSAKLAINPVWFTAAARRDATGLESALHCTLTLMSGDKAPATGRAPAATKNGTSDVRS